MSGSYVDILRNRGETATVVTPFSWSRTLGGTGFRPPPHPAAMLGIGRCRLVSATGTQLFLQQALRSALAEVGDCVVYAQCPVVCPGGPPGAARAHISVSSWQSTSRSPRLTNGRSRS